MAATGRRPLADDTPFEIEDIQMALWRNMTPQHKMRLISGMCRRINTLTREGVQSRYPGATRREVFLRSAIIRLGYDLAVEAFPDASGLQP